MFSFFKKKPPPLPAIAITDENFEELVLQSQVPVLVDFWGGGCGPCNILSPIIDELADEFQGRALIGKVNAHSNPKLSAFFKIKSIPTLMFFANGQLTERFQGLVPKPNLEEILEEYIVELEQLQNAEEEEE